MKMGTQRSIAQQSTFFVVYKVVFYLSSLVFLRFHLLLWFEGVEWKTKTRVVRGYAAGGGRHGSSELGRRSLEMLLTSTPGFSSTAIASLGHFPEYEIRISAILYDG